MIEKLLENPINAKIVETLDLKTFSADSLVMFGGGCVKMPSTKSLKHEKNNNNKQF